MLTEFIYLGRDKMTNENCRLDKLEKESYRKLSEIRKLKHRLKRYWTKLTKESLKAAKDQGLELRVAQGPVIFKPNELIVFDYRDNFNDNNLLRLARPSYPSLYRKYQEGLERYEELRHKLEELDVELEDASKQQG